MKITIDPKSGFCFGVINAITKAEEYLQHHKMLYCLGEIVHNEQETSRLEKLGLVVIDKTEFEKLENTTVLLRAHGEAPETYETAKRNNLNLIDASCPIVLKLQQKVKKAAQNNQVLIFGKSGHPEVIALKGQSPDKVTLISSASELDNIDLEPNIHLFSQTTKDKEEYIALKERLEKLQKEKFPESITHCTDSICGQVHNRKSHLQEFASSNDIVIFAGGKNSSNAMVLFEICKKANSNTFFIHHENEIDLNLLGDAKSIGITGATSTPKWLLDKIKIYLENNIQS